jgi:hypothetical protein
MCVHLEKTLQVYTQKIPNFKSNFQKNPRIKGNCRSKMSAQWRAVQLLVEYSFTPYTQTIFLVELKTDMTNFWTKAPCQRKIVKFLLYTRGKLVTENLWRKTCSRVGEKTHLRRIAWLRRCSSHVKKIVRPIRDRRRFFRHVKKKYRIFPPITGQHFAQSANRLEMASRFEDLAWHLCRRIHRKIRKWKHKLREKLNKTYHY